MESIGRGTGHCQSSPHGPNSSGNDISICDEEHSGGGKKSLSHWARRNSLLTTEVSEYPHVTEKEAKLGQVRNEWWVRGWNIWKARGKYMYNDHAFIADTVSGSKVRSGRELATTLQRESESKLSPRHFVIVAIPSAALGFPNPSWDI